jgi:hypothetical protein
MDTTIQDILQTPNYYDDKESYRRYSFVSCLINNSIPSARGTSVYLSGWSDQAVMDVSLSKKAFKVQDTTLYLVALKPELEIIGDILNLTPGMFTWQVTENPGYDVSPYNVYIYSAAQYSLLFQPTIPISFSEVESLVFHLESASLKGSVIELKVSLWDYSEDRWALINDLVWGKNEIPDPARYVNHSGMIQVQVESLSNYVQIDRSDFTLSVKK